MILDIISASLWIVGAVFFLAGTVGLLRFPDVYARLHALSKADNLGLGFVTAGLVLHADSIAVALKDGVVWALVLVSSSISCQLIARSARSAGVEPRRPVR
jgi:multicomponent Na+:H+ antiporter subunit G